MATCCAFYALLAPCSSRRAPRRRWGGVAGGSVRVGGALVCGMMHAPDVPASDRKEHMFMRSGYALPPRRSPLSVGRRRRTGSMPGLIPPLPLSTPAQATKRSAPASRVVTRYPRYAYRRRWGGVVTGSMRAGRAVMGIDARPPTPLDIGTDHERECVRVKSGYALPALRFPSSVGRHRDRKRPRGRSGHVD
ncbi:hypothetical protein B0H14DRAFT_3452876 [Mycena olivaceomarginata]|nr:hypothetical protein B0H14DRAFT_3452876 [Mycena olivaceomarginata]